MFTSPHSFVPIKNNIKKLLHTLCSPILFFTLTLLLLPSLIHAQDNFTDTEDNIFYSDEQRLYISYTPSLIIIPFISSSEEIKDTLDSNNTYIRNASALSIRYILKYLLLQFSYIPTQDILNTDAHFYISQILNFSTGAHYPFTILKNTITLDIAMSAALSINFAGYNKKNNIDTISEQFVYLGIGLNPALLFDFLPSKNFGIVAGIDGIIQYIPTGVPEESVFLANNKIQTIITIGTTIGFYTRF